MPNKKTVSPATPEVITAYVPSTDNFITGILMLAKDKTTIKELSKATKELSQTLRTFYKANKDAIDIIMNSVTLEIEKAAVLSFRKMITFLDRLDKKNAEQAGMTEKEKEDAEKTKVANKAWDSITASLPTLTKEQLTKLMVEVSMAIAKA